MKNYKIINTHTNEIIKALNDLGYVWTPKKFDEQDCLLSAHWILAKDSGAIAYSSTEVIDNVIDYQELTLPQLRDLVVLHRNDVKDATHIDKYGTSHVDINGQWYFWSNNKDDEIIDYGWNESASSRESDNRALKPIHKEAEQGLISGADALRVLADRKEVEANNIDFGYWIDARNLSVTDFFDDIHTFRLKPRTVKLEIEIPAPFEPKVGEVYWFLSSTHRDGYDFTEYEGTNTDHMFMLYGAFKSEQNIIAVRDALRGIKG